MLTQKEVFNLIKQIFGQNNIISVPVILLKKLNGNHPAALFLAQLIYWTGKSQDTDGWIYKSYEDWENELFIKKDKAIAIKKQLENLSLITTMLKKRANSSAPILHYKVNQEKLIEFLIENDIKSSKEEEKKQSDDIGKNEAAENTAYYHEDKQNKSDSGIFRKSENPKVGNADNRLSENPNIESGEFPLSTSNIDYMHRLHTEITTPHEKTTRLELKHHKQKNTDGEKNFALTIYDIFVSADINKPNRFTDFCMHDFKLGVEKLQNQKLKLTSDIVIACKNYAKVLALKKSGETWWQAELPFQKFCQENIIARYFLPEKFKLDAFLLYKKSSRSPPKRIGDCNAGWLENLSEIPF